MKPIEIFEKAQIHSYGIGQFNISTDEQIIAAVEAAKELNSPIIIGTSEGEREFIGIEQVVALIKTWKEKTGLPIILHADHCKTFESVKEVVDAGYDSVHFDGSKLPFEENVRITKRVIEYAKSINPNIMVEGEIGYLPGGSDIHGEVTIKPSDLTQPEEAKKFVQETEVDSLAIAIGNIHGMKENCDDSHLYLDRLEDIKRAVPGTLLVLHGGSGTPKDDIEKAIKLGIVKININTEIRLAYRNALKGYLEEYLSEVKTYKILEPAMEAVKIVVKDKIKLFGSDGKA
ncbi:MAG TPA: class II fructose-bisphosphate aldolase [Candidatus Portnoybacteria bacterium]|jgi:fructose-bisphosphate aldolase, class II|nr:class II fructose-bisphosphate aldolase [Candidatus Portnoybacteria bacterium]MDD5752109.1 class II fructose-bisphosphate aldolase [Candidatus Portnoybacteria bacterium]HOZ16604.1 class II fructose-bisphosphate aldolase [Candidatus Portnoybacteria bacterium]HPH52380.1 class II fructose-bisphosphate aldolase [Candidatus Portnoybacteria bacterium]HPM28299.1 class II fructose-bisphosphate aldolase [Candidatus Portnoybacteria bacterium]